MVYRMETLTGKIYRLICGEYYYIGSTRSALSQRFSAHKSLASKYPHIRVYQKAIEIGWNNITIETIEDISYNTRQQLLMKENTYINLLDPFCLNSRPAYTSIEARKQKEREHNKEYRLEHLDHLRQKAKEYKANAPALTEKEKEYRKTYQREYMRKYRALK